MHSTIHIQGMLQEGSIMQHNGIVVAGDWVVDEYWVISRHRAEAASRTGHELSLALHGEDSCVRALCGAGQVASILAQSTKGGRPFVKLHGLGYWDDGDTEALRAMLNPALTVGHTPHRLVHNYEPQQGPQLHNLGKGQYGTTRVVRLYRFRADRTITLDQRIDWDLQKTEYEQVPDLRNANVARWHIVIKDLLKGCVTSRLIQDLNAQFPDADWYISSKRWQPAWLKEVPRNRLRLFFIPQRAASDAVKRGSITSPKWITSDGVPTKDALTIISDLSQKYPGAALVIVSDAQHVLAKESHGDAPKSVSTNADPNDADMSTGYVLTMPKGAEEVMEHLPMSSVFFPSLIANLAVGTGTLSRRLLAALNFTTAWMTAERGRLTDRQWIPAESQKLKIDDVNLSETENRCRPFGWGWMLNDWNQAFSNIGLVKTAKGHREFQLWRAMTDINDYVSCIPSKTRHLLDLLREGREFIDMHVSDRRHKSFMIVDGPGTGKSFLAKCVAKALNIQDLKFSLTRTASRTQVLDIFKAVASQQTSDREKPFLVFVDEINAKVDGKHAYDAFLEPLEDGTFVHEGAVFHLAPCIWLFAGTESPSESEASDKGPDFESRLSRPPMHLRFTTDSHDIKELECVEKVYVGIATIRSEFPEVTRVTPAVLEAFRLVPEDLGPRGIKRLVKSLIYIQRGTIHAGNFPEGWHRREKLGGEIPHVALQDWLRRADAEKDASPATLEKLFIDLKTKPDDDIWWEPSTPRQPESTLPAITRALAQAAGTAILSGGEPVEVVIPANGHTEPAR